MRTVEDRFWEKVKELNNGCWQWTGSLASKGYGFIRNNGRKQHVHQYAYNLIVGKVPKGLCLDHLCRNRGCVNPEHLEPVTNKINSLRGYSPMAINARKTHCPSGHRYTNKNIWLYFGRRYCRACRSGKRKISK